MGWIAYVVSGLPSSLPERWMDGWCDVISLLYLDDTNIASKFYVFINCFFCLFFLPSFCERERERESKRIIY